MNALCSLIENKDAGMRLLEDRTSQSHTTVWISVWYARRLWHIDGGRAGFQTAK